MRLGFKKVVMLIKHDGSNDADDDYHYYRCFYC